MQPKTKKPKKLVARRQTTKLATAGYKPPPVDTWGLNIRDLPPFTFNTVRVMLWDPTIKLGLAMRAAPIANCTFAYQEGTEWVEGVKADKPEVGEYVHQQLKRIWLSDIFKILKSQVWGWMGGEWSMKVGSDGGLEVDELNTRHPTDIRLMEYDGQPWGVRFKRVQGYNSSVDLPFPAAFWHAFLPEDGMHYGQSVLRGAYSPWADKWLDGGALDVRRLFAHKDAYGGVDMSYPVGVTEVLKADGSSQEVSNQEIASQIGEQLRAGGVTTRPAVYDQQGKELWTLTRATVPANPAHIFQYPKDLDVEILRGLEIPDDIITSEGMSGAWAGKAVPQQAFYMSLQQWANQIVFALVRNLLEPLVYMRYGRAEEFEVTIKPLGGTPGDKPEGQQEGGQPGGVNPWSNFMGSPPQRMALDPVAAVGEGVLTATEIVEAAQQMIGKRIARVASEQKLIQTNAD